MVHSEVYRQLASAAVISQPESTQHNAIGLFLTSGVANRFRKGEITEDEARQQIQTIINTDSIWDPTALKAIRDAFTGARGENQLYLEGLLSK